MNNRIKIGPNSLQMRKIRSSEDKYDEQEVSRLSENIRSAVKISVIGRTGFYGPQYDYGSYNEIAKEVGETLAREGAVCVAEDGLEERDTNASIYELVRSGVEKYNGSIELVKCTDIISKGAGIIVAGTDYEDDYYLPQIQNQVLMGIKPVVVVSPPEPRDWSLPALLTASLEEIDEKGMYLGTFTSPQKGVIALLNRLRKR